ncbi:hypothetical protein ACSVH5_11845 [Flavobacterium sp. RSSA_27]|uniref:hypothetical protein n=1 Tax=Flavobacterium sp. RSSA_27 TaxID=3447667 RepID=UPI003F2F314E
MTEEKFPGKIEITLPTAQEWVKKYKAPKAEDNSKKVDAYLIPLESLQKVMDQKIDAVRAYKGINDAGEETLMLVGTVLDSKTGIYVDVFPNGIGNAESGDTEIVYDGTVPCPPNGDPNSPMNT